MLISKNAPFGVYAPLLKKIRKQGFEAVTYFVGFFSPICFARLGRIQFFHAPLKSAPMAFWPHHKMFWHFGRGVARRSRRFMSVAPKPRSPANRNEASKRSQLCRSRQVRQLRLKRRMCKLRNLQRQGRDDDRHQRREYQRNGRVHGRQCGGVER